jgi:outer membrane receptor protein involved in Fe transport
MSALRRLITLFAGLGAMTLAYAAGAADAPSAEADQVLEEVQVTGSRVITNGNDSPNPVTVVTLDELQASHPSTVFEALEDLPQFASGRGGSLGGSTGQGSSNNSIASLNLRALGPLRDLVLFDGHRVPPQNVDGTVDINQIPQLLLERVDLETGGASAVYGSDAITGVVNFITNRKFNGLKAEIQGGISEQQDDRSNQFSVAMGTDVFGSRGHIEGSVQSYYDGGLYRNQRSWLQAPGTNYWTLQGNGTAAAPYFLTQNAFDASQTYGGKIVGPASVGGKANPLLNQNFTTNSVLSTFVNGTTAGLTGSSQVGGQGGLANEDVTLKTPIDQVQLFTRFDFDLTDNLHYFADLSYNIEHQYSTLANVRSGTSATSKLGAGFVMSVNNAFLPTVYQNQLQAAGFTTFNVGKIWDTTNYPPNTYDYHIHNAYLNTGLEGKIGSSGWHWEASVTRSQAVQANTANTTINTGRLFAALDSVIGPNGTPVCRVSLTANAGLYPGCVPLNIFGPTATTAAMWNYILMPTRYVATTDLQDAEGSITGSPFSTWAGPVNTALSAEWRKLQYIFLSGGEPQNVVPLDCTGLSVSPAGNCVVPTATDIGTSQTYGNGSAGSPLRQPVRQTVREIALEADFPLLKDAPFAKDVELLLAGRNAGYSSFGTPAASVPQATVTFSADTWKAGLDWHFNDTFTLRGTRSRDFRAPNLGDLFLPGRVQGFTLSQDLLTGAQNVLTQQQIGGNPRLQPEVGYTSTVGLVIKPSNAFSLSIDAYDIAISNAITSVDGSSAGYQSACYASGGASSFCQLQVRPLGSYTNTSAANTASLWFTSAPVNIAFIHTQGVDVEGNSNLHIAGHPLQLRALVTYQPHIWTQQPLAATLDAGGVSSPRERVMVTARYSPFDVLTVEWSTRWRSALKNVDPRTLQSNGQPVLIAPGSEDVRAAAFSNVTLTYHVPGLSHGNLDAYLNVLNVFNQIPPIYVPAGGGSLFGQAAGANGVSYYPADDAIGRYYNVGLRLRL